MGTFTDKMFSFKGAYKFESIPNLTLEEFLYGELETQLHQLEELWVRLDLQKLSGKRTFSQEINYRAQLEKVRFRLQETIRFLSQNAGPRIIQFVCSELLDFINEHDYTHRLMLEEDVKSVEHILVVMNSFFQPEVTNLQQISQEVVVERLKQAVEKLLNRFSGKNREESLQSLANPTFKVD